jgi:hypothetical protein
MNEAQVKEALLALHSARESFRVVFSGKENKRKNGHYKWSADGSKQASITIHDGNFQNENALMYTAIHEFAHHILVTEYGERSGSGHTQFFWATVHDLLDAAEEKGIYRRERPEAVRDLAEAAKKIDREIARLQRQLGQVIGRLREVCGETGGRWEDVVEHDAGISRQTALKAVKAACLPEKSAAALGQDAQSLVLRTGSPENQAAMIALAAEKKSIPQLQALSAPRRKVIKDSVMDLMQTKRRIEASISGLQRRLEVVTEALARMEEKEPAAV